MLEADLKRARGCYRRRSWGEAHKLLSLADRRTPLAAKDLEWLATCAYLIGHDPEFDRFMERAYRAHVQDGNQPRAGRCAFWLGLTQLLRGETAQANGWLARARRLIAAHDCVEHGYLLLPVAEQRLEERDPDAAFATATQAAHLGVRFGDADLTACARHMQGRARIQQGKVQTGLTLLDEAMIAVSREELSPIMTGLIYCSVIDACQQVFAFTRAHEWTVALTHWCEQQPEMVAFTGLCLVHRAEVMQFRGSWGEAMSEATLAYERTSQTGDESTSGAAMYRQGEIHRVRGDFAAAEGAYREASRLGWEPQPGLSLLRMAQGRTDRARAAIRRVLGATTEPLLRASLLPAYIDIVLAAGDATDARTASGELDEIAQRCATDVLLATAARARGAVALAEGDAQAAQVALRQALDLWQWCEAPHEIARVRLLTALTCRELGDDDSANLEFDAARALLERLGATPDLAHLDSLRTHTAHGLTPREQEILRRIAAGQTNKAIATELVVSERTVDRHVSNILTKLGVPSRAAATAYAYTHNLL